MSNGDTPETDRAEPELGEPEVTRAEPEIAEPEIDRAEPEMMAPEPARAEPEIAAPKVEPRPAAPASSGTHNLIEELRHSMAVVARSGQPRRIRIRTYGRYRFTKFVIWLFVLLGYLIVLAGIAFLFWAAWDAFAGGSGRGINLTVSGLGSLNGVFMSRLLISLGIVWAGFFTIAFGQFAKAQIDGADYARQTLAMQKAIAEGAIDIDTRRRADRPAASEY